MVKIVTVVVLGLSNHLAHERSRVRIPLGAMISLSESSSSSNVYYEFNGYWLYLKQFNYNT